MSESILDLEALLAPLEANEGAGEDPRGDLTASAPYQKLRDSRSEARAEERERDSRPGEDVAPPTQWRDVLRFGMDCLATRGKDFEVAAYITEALVRLHDLPGLAAGVQLIDGMLDRYWDHGFPLPEDDVPEDERLEGRSAPIGGLSGEGADGTIMQPLRRMMLFPRADGSPATLHLWLQAEEAAKITDPEKREALHETGVPTMGGLTEEGRAGTAKLRRVGLDARAVRAAWLVLSTKMDERFGSYSPSMRRVSEVLERIEEIAVLILGQLEEAAAEEGGGDDGVGTDDGAGQAAGGGGTGRTIRTRDDVIKHIEEAAAWFRRMEPHSPLAFTLTDAARRARLPLPELLEEVLPDAEARRAMLTALGIRFQEPTQEM